MAKHPKPQPEPAKQPADDAPVRAAAAPAAPVHAASYRLTKAAYLNDRYFVAGSVVEWSGPPNSAMEAVDADGQSRIDAHRAARRPVQHRANEVPQPGGDPADPTWAPAPRPAFAVKTARVPDSQRAPGEPKSTDNEASVSRNAASPQT